MSVTLRTCSTIGAVVLEPAAQDVEVDGAADVARGAARPARWPHTRRSTRFHCAQAGTPADCGSRCRRGEGSHANGTHPHPDNTFAQVTLRRKGHCRDGRHPFRRSSDQPLILLLRVSHIRTSPATSSNPARPTMPARSESGDAVSGQRREQRVRARAPCRSRPRIASTDSRLCRIEARSWPTPVLSSRPAASRIPPPDPGDLLLELLDLGVFRPVGRRQLLLLPDQLAEVVRRGPLPASAIAGEQGPAGVAPELRRWRRRPTTSPPRRRRASGRSPAASGASWP